MVGGRIRCLGSLTHLKSKFAKGYQIDINFIPHVDVFDTIIKLIDYLHQICKGTSILEQFGFSLKLHVPLHLDSNDRHNKKNKVSIGNLFRILESVKTKFNIREYSCQQTSLEQIFLSFASEQDEEKRKETDQIAELIKLTSQSNLRIHAEVI